MNDSGDFVVTWDKVTAATNGAVTTLSLWAGSSTETPIRWRCRTDDEFQVNALAQR